MDDLGFINNNLVINCLNHSREINEHDIFSIYPLDILKIKATFDTYSTTYLNTYCKLFPNSQGEFLTKTAWKRDKLPCKTVEFIHASSNRPRNMAYKVCVSQVLPIIYNASHFTEALYDLNKLRTAFVMNGFDKRHIQRNIMFFLKNGNFPKLRFSIFELLEAFGRE